MTKLYQIRWVGWYFGIIVTFILVRCYDPVLIPGDVLTDVGIWAGQTLYSAHKLVLALSSSYFRLILTGAGAADNR